ncbi:Putative glycosyltransferase EpsE [Poriferisphaera corsica]|uniref:Glycosyltransferase EpsE n=1 Tax=Poriferisphaera corsica TaxID=2528020 RepID=A0A517YW45_9BACT|nr:glycosyltransferase family 2 protein [Poriferisphaera corsica]QDU34453.1 Putative glycosyltransferase EpsE [Poriferisphaera corsica]
MTQYLTNNTTTHSPLISVLMPVYNAQDYLTEAIESILNQTSSDFELICINDGSTDDSLSILNGYQKCDPRIIVLSQENQGVVGSRNNALTHAKGEFIALMDADDLCDPTRFEKQIGFLKANPDHVAVGSYLIRSDPYGSPAGMQKPPLNHETIESALIQGDGSAITQATMMIRTHALKAINGWSPEYNFVEDLDMQIRLSELGKLANLPEALFTYRRHMNSFCFRNYKSMTTQIADILNQAYKRRNLDKQVTLYQVRPDLNQKHNPADIYRNWAYHAIENRNRLIACKHALNALRRDPFNTKSWKVAYCSLSA